MNYNPFSLEGKTILVTGASSGIGKATAIECSKMGASLIITGRNEERLQNTFLELHGSRHKKVIADLENDEQIGYLADCIECVDGVFFSAGITDTTLVKFYSRSKFEKIININLISPALLTKTLLKKKKINKSASLVYMSSYGAEQVEIGLGVYASSKMGLNALVHAIAKENIVKGIRANAIMPMMVKTELLGSLTSIDSESIKEDEKRYPLGYGKPEDIAYAAIYLLSDASRWVTGSFIKMDGGSVL